MGDFLHGAGGVGRSPTLEKRMLHAYEGLKELVKVIDALN